MWIDRPAALARLGVRAQTLYAYVSRGRIGARPDPADPRRSLYNEEDIDLLAGRRRRGRGAQAIAASALAWGEAAIPTTISTIDHGRLIYRGQDAIVLSRTMSAEEVAALLWQQAEPLNFAAGGLSGDGGAFAALAHGVAQARPGMGRSGEALRRDGAIAVGLLAAGFGLADAAAPLHARLADLWSIEAHGDLLRRILLLMADHELNASTFAVRVAASTGASIAACLLAGLATLSGPRHGGAGAALAMLVEDAERHGAEAALDRWLALGNPAPGFGHLLYPEGDARAAALLDRVEIDPVMARLAEAVARATGARPNIDFALCAIVRSLGLPPDAPFTIFALGRSIGWVAHAIEQIQAGTLIRPRARYEGALPPL